MECMEARVNETTLTYMVNIDYICADIKIKERFFLPPSLNQRPRSLASIYTAMDFPKSFKPAHTIYYLKRAAINRPFSASTFSNIFERTVGRILGKRPGVYSEMSTV